MNDEPALLRAVLERPDDDTPRLVYADYCEEHGDPERGEFIRVQVETAKGGRCYGLPLGECQRDRPPLCPVCRLLSREYTLWRENGDRWAKGLPGELPVIRPGCAVRAGLGLAVDYAFRRGFVEFFECESRDFARLMGAMSKRHPVRRVRLRGWVDAMWQLQTRPMRVERYRKATSLLWPGVEFEIADAGEFQLSPAAPG